MEFIILILLVALIGAVLFLIIKTNAKNADAEALITRLREENRDSLIRQQAAARAELEAVKASYDRQVENLRAEMKRQSDAMAETARLQFENISHSALDSHSRHLRDANRSEMEAIIAPLREKLAEFSRSMAENHLTDNASRRSLSEQIDRLIRLNNTIGEETRSLTSALKGDSKVQGDWGEMILETLLESAGMMKEVNFFVQPTKDEAGNTLVDDDGSRQRPDILVKLPDEHSMIIDSKVSLTAYVRLCEASSPEEREAATAAHLRSVRKHVDELGAKQYQKHWSRAADHMLMFIPNEGAYFAAINADPQLWKYAYDKKVVIVSPTHVFSVMQIISQLWRQERQNRNAAEIARLGGLLYDRLVRFAETFRKISMRIEDSSRAYDEAFSQLASSSQSITRTAERLRDLGAKTSRRLAPDMSGADDTDNPALPD